MFLLTEMLDEMMGSVQSQDRVRITLMADGLDHEIWLPFMLPDQLTAHRIMVEAERVLQSNKDWMVDAPIMANLTHARLPTGQGRLKYWSKLEEFLQKKRCIVQIPDGNCCARAIVTAKAIIDSHPQRKSITRGWPVQERLARDLLQKTNIPEGQSCGKDEWDKFQCYLGDDYELIVISRDVMNSVVFRGENDAMKKIVLYHAENHFSVVTSLPAFYGKKYVCPRCLEGYAHPHIHRCKKDACVGCQAKTKCKKDESKRCSQCNRMFVSELCLQNHYKNGLCRYLKACKECGKTFHSFNEHKCGYVMCKVCNEKKPKDHKCYIRPLKNKNDAEEGKNLQYIFYDFESMLIDNIHVPMLCVAHKVCDDCITFPMNSKECECQRERKIFQGSNTLKEFGDWVWNGRKEKVIAMAHNAQAYDLHFIMQYVHDQGKKPSVILNKEKKILSMECENVKFIDSLNFLPMALAKLPKAFGLKELKKGFFPHLFNIPANQNYKGPIPDKMYYDPDGMMDDKRTEFLEWYNQQDHFDFQQSSTNPYT